MYNGIWKRTASIPLSARIEAVPFNEPELEFRIMQKREVILMCMADLFLLKYEIGVKLGALIQ